MPSDNRRELREKQKRHPRRERPREFLTGAMNKKYKQRANSYNHIENGV